MNRTLLKFKHRCEFSTAKKTLLFLAALLLSVAANAQQKQTNVTQVSTNYSKNPPEVTFRVWWNAGTRVTNGASTYSPKVWLLVDYEISPGSWTRATIAGEPRVTATHNSPTSYTIGATGFWLDGSAANNNAYSATVTVPITVNTPLFKWCAFASDCAPNAVYTGTASHKLRGTAPFYITYKGESPTTVNAKTYIPDATKEVVAMTDATGCPANCKMRNQAVSSGVCCSGLTTVNGYCRDLTADNACTYISCGVEVELLARTPPSTWSTQLGCPSGWRPATASELLCIATNARALCGMSSKDFWWTGQYTGHNSGHISGIANCTDCGSTSVFALNYAPGCGYPPGNVGCCSDCVSNGVAKYFAQCLQNYSDLAGAVKCVR